MWTNTPIGRALDSRAKLEEHHYTVEDERFRRMGFGPKRSTEEELEAILSILSKFRITASKEKIVPVIRRKNNGKH